MGRLLRHRGRPVGGRRRARVPSRRGPDRRRRAALPAVLGARSGGGEARLRILHRLVHRAARRPSGDARVPLRRIRIGRHQAPAATPRHARGRGGSAAAGSVLVDLLNVVRQGVRASVESYSLKQIEKFYLAAREGPVTEAGFSVVEYERWMRERDQSILDCDRRLQPGRLHLDPGAAGLAGGTPRRSRGALAGRRLDPAERGAGMPSEAQQERTAEVQRRMDALTEGVPADRSGTPTSCKADGCWRSCSTGIGATTSRRGGCGTTCDSARRRISSAPPRGSAGSSSNRSSVRRRRASPALPVPAPGPQVRLGSEPVDPDPRHGDFGASAGTIWRSTTSTGRWTSRRAEAAAVHPTALIPGTPIPARAMQGALSHRRIT